MRLLAAVDLGETLEGVVASAKALAEGLGLEAELLHVVPTPYAEALARRFPELSPVWQEALARAEARVGEALGAMGLPYRVVRGFPAQVVAGEALRSKVVLLGREEEGALEAWARGEWPATSSTGGGPGPPPAKALGPGAAHGRGAGRKPRQPGRLPGGRGLGQGPGGRGPGPPPGERGRGCCFPTYLDPRRLSAAEVLERARGHLEALLRATGVVEVAWGAEEVDLLHLAQARGADLLVLGSKAKSTWRHRLGRMVEVLFQRSPLPLLVVPEAAVW